jgi:hypothetical protein
VAEVFSLTNIEKLFFLSPSSSTEATVTAYDSFAFIQKPRRQVKQHPGVNVMILKIFSPKKWRFLPCRKII